MKNKICIGCNSRKIRKEDGKFICNDCGFIFDDLTNERSNKVEEIISNAIIQLYPKSMVQDKLNKKLSCSKEDKQKWKFANLKKLILSINNIHNNPQAKKWDGSTGEEYYFYQKGNEKILFEINNGEASDDLDCPIVSITFSNRWPSNEILLTLINILKNLKSKDFDFKIYSNIHGGFISLEDISLTK